MATDEEWPESEDFEILEDLLYQGVVSEDYTEAQLEALLSDIGPPEGWNDTEIHVDGEGMWTFEVTVDGETHIFSVGEQEDFEHLYQWLDSEGIDFDIIRDSP